MQKIKLFDESILVRKLPFNFDDDNPLFSFFKELDTEDIPAIWLHSFYEVSVNSDSVVFDNKGQIQYEIFEYCLKKKYKQLEKNYSLNVKKLIHPRQFASILMSKLKYSISNFRSSIKTSAVKTYVLITDDRANNNFYHWINEALIRLLALGSLTENSILLLPEDCWKYEYVRNLLKVFEINEDQIQIIPNNQKLKIKNLKVVSCSMLAPGAYNYILNIKLRDRIEAFYVNDLTLDLGDKIYISRDRSIHRKVDNEEAVVEYLSKRGFIKICAEDYSIIELISIMMHAKYFVGMVSAGLTHMMFMKEGFVLELIHEDFICPTNDIWPGGYTEKYSGVNYYSMANGLGLNYLYQPCKRVYLNEYLLADNILVDMPKLKENIEKMFA